MDLFSSKYPENLKKKKTQHKGFKGKNWKMPFSSRFQLSQSRKKTKLTPFTPWQNTQILCAGNWPAPTPHLSHCKRKADRALPCMHFPTVFLSRSSSSSTLVSYGGRWGVVIWVPFWHTAKGVYIRLAHTCVSSGPITYKAKSSISNSP